MVTEILLAVAGLALLTWAADHLVLGSSRLAQRLRISSVVVGVVVIGLGTSTPEFLVSGLAAARGDTGIAVGNSVGSNVLNLTLLLGVAAVIAPIPAASAVVRREVPLAVAAIVLFGLLAVLGLDDVTATVLTAAGVLALWLLVRWARTSRAKETLANEVDDFLGTDPPTGRATPRQGGTGPAETELLEADLGRAELGRAELVEADLGHAELVGAELCHVELVKAEPDRAEPVRADLVQADLVQAAGAQAGPGATGVGRAGSVWGESVRAVLGLLGVLAGAQLLVVGASAVAEKLGVSQTVIGFTLVAFGTSLPELVTSIQAQRRGESDLVVGNLFGSNLFNGLVGGAIIGFADAGTAHAGVVLVVAMVLTAGLAWALLRRGHRLTRPEGFVLVLAYAAMVPLLLSA